MNPERFVGFVEIPDEMTQEPELNAYLEMMLSDAADEHNADIVPGTFELISKQVATTTRDGATIYVPFEYLADDYEPRAWGIYMRCMATRRATP